MKLAGKKISGPNIETIILPRGDGEPIVFKAQAVLDFDDFEKMCPMPKPATVVRPGGKKSANFEDPTYKAAIELHAKKRFAWIVLTSLHLGTPDLEWERVDYGDPNTWLSYEDELREAGISNIEIGRIHRGVMIANALDDEKLEEARNAFLASQQALADPSSFPRDEPSSTPSGVPAND
jgi:hypothetical protein